MSTEVPWVAADVKAAAASVMSTDDKMEGATELDVE